MITSEQLKQLLPNTPKIDDWSVVLNDILPKYDINDERRIAHFLAQCMHESANFTSLKENLNYSGTGLVKTWPKRFTTPDLVNHYARQPEMIANFVYANRLGNGDELSGDGWKYRGRGLIQLTGKSNYQAFADSVGMKIDEVPSYLETLQGATEAACWFWKTNNLNSYADVDDIRGLTKAVNGPAMLGLHERENNFNRAITVLGT